MNQRLHDQYLAEVKGEISYEQWLEGSLMAAHEALKPFAKTGQLTIKIDEYYNKPDTDYITIWRPIGDYRRAAKVLAGEQ